MSPVLVVTVIAVAAVVAYVLGSTRGASRARLQAAGLEADHAAAVVQIEALRDANRRERELADERIAAATQSREQLLEQFTAVSVQALDANGARFMELARAELDKERLKAHGELEQRQQAIGELVQPVTRKLAEVEGRIAAFDKDRVISTTALTEQIRALRQSSDQMRIDAGALTKALRQPQGRGQWGELQLRRVVEMAGLAEHCRDFTTQTSHTTEEDRRLRPDMVVQLPNGRAVVVDSKAPLDAFLSAAEAPDDEAAAPHLARHAEQVRTHVAQLARKDYSAHCDGALPDVVVLFLPAEHLFAAAVQQRPGLVEEAFDKGVVIASPTTLLTLLHAVAQGWKEERLARNAAEIAALGRELHERIAGMASHFAMVGKRLDSATEAYNKAVGALEGRVLVSARRFEQLDAARSATDMPELHGAAKQVRRLVAPELLVDLAADAGDDERVA